MTFAQKLEEILIELDAEEAKAYGMDVGKRIHMISAVLDRWFKRFPGEDIDQAISEAVSSGSVLSDDQRTYLSLTDD